MQITLHLVGILRDYYRTTADFSNGPVALECAADATVRGLISDAGVPDENEYFIMLNGERVDLTAAATRTLNEGDAVALVAVIKGG